MRLFRETANLKLVQRGMNHKNMPTIGKYTTCCWTKIFWPACMPRRGTVAQSPGKNPIHGKNANEINAEYNAGGLGVPSSNLGAPTRNSAGQNFFQ
jgi:hypothetical protein